MVSSPSGSFVQQLRRTGETHGLDHVRFADGLVAEREIGADGIMQEDDILRNIADHRAPAGEVDLLERHVIDEDIARTALMEAQEQVDDGRLAAARGDL